MPKFGAHILFAELAHARQPALFPAVHLNALRLGAIGPDPTLFMFDPATKKPELRRGIETALNVLETMQDVTETFLQIKDRADEPEA